MADGSENDDIFHDIIMSEERSQSQGFTAGQKIGQKTGMEDGYRLGWEKGSGVGSELGFYVGFCQKILQKMEDSQEGKQRAIKTAQSLLKLVDEFPLTNPTQPQLFEMIQQIRSKFKQLTSVLGINASYNWSVSESKGVSF
ncbi:protein LTO1 homolog [Ylistrum balloti]|uniref:protein LTO1 homolog n=1 Tax=Ylistrum balloti TaxID=509963 RepID=UPI002905D125|nr:protein LTO1 homolog [Ylistrum balloti]